jgi:C4-dicarboxylate transporter DctQ subunit
MLHRLLLAIGLIARGLDRFGGLVVLPAMTLMMTLDVILRYVFNAPLLWGLELAEHLLIIVFLTGIVQCTRTDGNIRMDLVYIHMRARAKRLVMLLYCVIGMFVFALLAGKAVADIPFLLSIPETTEYLRLPIGGYYIGIVAISALMILYFAVRAVSFVLGSDVPDGETDSEAQGIH